MLLRVRMAAVARVAAALAAITLSGAPHVLAMHAPVEGHRCSCRAHAQGQQCECALRREASRATTAAGVGGLRCHPPAERRGSGSESRGSKDVPCVEGTCGASGPRMISPAGVEPFCLPAARPLASRDGIETRIGAADRVPEQPVEPETPPPKAA